MQYIEGIGAVYSQKLLEAGITNTEELLEKGSTVQGRKEIVKTTGISEKLVLRWVNMADLYRIKGIGQEYAELLEAAGANTVLELAEGIQRISWKRWEPPTRKGRWWAAYPLCPG